MALRSLLGRARDAFHKVSLVVGWPNLLLCSAAGTLVAALIVLTATPIVEALLSWTRLAAWKTACVWGVWGGGLLAATTVGAVLGVRVGTARAIRRLPDGYRLWFGKENPMVEARRVLDRWDSDTERAEFLSCAREMRGQAAHLTDAEERMKYFTDDLEENEHPAPSSFYGEKGKLLLLLCNGIEEALAEFTPDIVSAAGKPRGDDFDQYIDMAMDLTVQEHERSIWYGEDADLLAPRNSERAQLSLAKELVYSRWGLLNYRRGLDFWIPAVWSAFIITAGASCALAGFLLAGPAAYGLAVTYTVTAVVVYSAVEHGLDVVRWALPSGRRSRDVRASLAAAANPLERVTASLGALDGEHRNRLLVRVSEEIRAAVRTYEAKATGDASPLRPSAS